MSYLNSINYFSDKIHHEKWIPLSEYYLHMLQIEEYYLNLVHFRTVKPEKE